MALYPTFSTPVIIDAKAEPVAEYKQSVFFDIKKGDIVLDSAGKCQMANGCDAWLQWCTKMLFTELDSCMSYLNQGVEMEYAIKREDREAQEIAIENAIKEALMRDPSNRTIEVSNFAFEYHADGVTVTFCIFGADGYTGTLSVEIGGE